MNLYFCTDDAGVYDENCEALKSLQNGGLYDDIGEFI